MINTNINIVDSYRDYSDLLNDVFQPQLIYRGDFLARHLHSSIKEEINTWILWENNDSIEICKVNKQENSVFISEIFNIPNPLLNNENLKRVFCNENSIVWLNLCHYKDADGNIHYDPYYDIYPVIDNCEDISLTIGEIRSQLYEIVQSTLVFNHGDQVYLYSRIGNYNILQDILVKSGVTVLARPLFREDMVLDECKTFSASPLNLYMVTEDVNIVFPMPENKDLLVYESAEKSSSKKSNIQIQHTNSDMMGNRWLSVILPNGEQQSSLCAKSVINYNIKSLVD